ncbi:hypothetical protein [Marinobacterium sedimentorum]|uniref:hypothetical protein n=1 Tax=Marinobacterium sedimentorum TaxID=2927804 RepID=UPI0020C5B9E0|nr:hypothetical protein [Marinobacterium sedimentorum]MCP8687725.1 hypothetical protein [Marinobacterium sedimentorum]
MNATLCMNNPVTAQATAEPSMAQMAKRLEISLLQEKLAELNQQLARLTAQADARERVIKTALDKQQALDTEVKRLRELDPDRTKKRADRLKKDKVELQDAVAQLRVTNKALLIKNRQLDTALNKAIKDINDNNAIPPVLTVELPRTGRWAIYSCERNGHYNILDITQDVSQTVQVIDGAVVTPKLRPLPKDLHATILQTHQQFHGENANG